jgi:hypothetical protein
MRKALLLSLVTPHSYTNALQLVPGDKGIIEALKRVW